jgi:transposase
MLTDYHLNRFLLGNNLKLISMRTVSGGYVWEVEKINPGSPCLRCGSLNTVKSGRCKSTVRDQPVRDTTLWLNIHKHRIYCKDCKKTFVEPVDGIWPRRKTTQRFRRFIGQSCARMNDMASVSRFYNVSHGFAYKVYYEQTAIKLREYKSALFWPEVIGIDEHFFRRKKGFTEFVTMVTDLKKRRTFDLVHGKDHKSLEEQLSHIPGRERVKVVVIDMSGTYKSFVKKFFPNAKIIADKFHVLRLFTPYIMKCGKDIHGHRQELKTRRKLLYSRIHLDYFMRNEIDRYLNGHDKLNELYRWKERFYEFYRIKGYNRAHKAMEKLLSEMKLSTLEEVQKLFRTLQRWKYEILKYFEMNYTNAFTERMNGTGKLIQRRAFGYKNFKNYKLRTLSACLFKTF